MERTHPLTRYRASQNPPLSEAELARRLDVGRSTVHRWETFQRAVDQKLLAHVSEQTGIPAKELRPDLVEKNEWLSKILSDDGGAQ